MALLFTVVFIVGVLVLGYYLSKDDNHDEWKGW
jgi:hypothetical protein